MPFNSETGKKAGQMSKRGNALPMELRVGLHELANHLLCNLDYDSLTTSQKLKLIDIALKHSLPRLTIEKQVTENTDTKITITNSEGKVLETIQKSE